MGREQEIGLLLERWAQVKEGIGQVVLLSGEAGIGKSRLVQVLQEHVAAEPQAWLTPCQCSPYYQNTALYPMIDLLERVVLRFEREESPPQKLRKLEGFVVQYGLPLAEAIPLFAALLPLPLRGQRAPSLTGALPSHCRRSSAGRGVWEGRTDQGRAARTGRGAGGSADHGGPLLYEAEVYRLKGALLLAHSAEQHAEAATYLRQALDIARQQQAKSLELRAAMSLSRLWQQQGKRDAARELLAPIYGWFTEGFDTADLQEARTLLDEWAG